MTLCTCLDTCVWGKNGADDAAFHETKIKTGRYYMARQLPATALHLARIQSGADTVMGLSEDQF